MSKLPSPDTVRRIEDAAAALIAAGTLNPTNAQVRDRLGGGSLATISPVMRAFRARQREQAREETIPLPPELQQLLTGQLTLLWQAAVQQADAGALAAREQADANIGQADLERDAALARVAELESGLAVLREVQAERDRLLLQEQGLAGAHDHAAGGGGAPADAERTSDHAVAGEPGGGENPAGR
ncbi:DNA-binding protein [Salmonella enterica]|uniref:DNA-binding protein n=1 Tax=Salmonella enterica TaxID=28901 RepID=UPI001E3F01CE|nr:DNA-binding protein [Salmonella enterica]